jgi:tetratricopeptide (TPR) repeat protein
MALLHKGAMNTSFIFCAKCGQSVPPEAAFCPGCGTQVVPAVTVHLADEAATPTVVGGRPQYGDGPFRAGDQVGPRYSILKLLGAGGMGAVYQAFDHELGVGVAIKVIRPAAQSDATAARDLEQRFKRELVLARQITHKYVVRIHDIGEVDGVKYLTMPYIDGETLADVLRREAKLSVPRTLAMATQVAAGLAAAHDKGIVHRDLKPENIMIEKDGGDALIMDFGIARTVESGSTQTAAGSVIGTLEYMAPEQAQGKKVDGRADVYALGLILYDCLVGRQRLAQTENPMTELLSRLAHSPTAPRQIDASIPEPLDRIVQRCLNPSPGERFESTADLVRALDGLTPDGHLRATDAATLAAAAVPRARRPAWQLAAVAALVLLAASAGWLLSNRGTPDASAAARDPLSVLVAEFDNRTGDAVFDGVLEQALGLGLEGATFITADPQRDALRSAAAIKAGSRLDEATSRLVAVREGVKLVLAGALLPSGSGYQLSVRAIDPAQGQDVASATETAADKSEVLEAIGEIATRLRRELGDTAAGNGDAGRETFTAASIEAARAYVLAQELAAAGKFGEAIVHYQEAVQRDPDFGRAYSGWATAAFRAGRPDEADELWKKSLALLERMTEREKYRTLGSYYLGPGANDEQAVQNYRMLVERYPADGPGLNNLAVAYFRTLDFKRAQEQGLKAAAVYPNSLNYRTNVALYAMYAGDFATAAAEAKKAIAMSPFDKAYLPIAIEALAAGNADGARAAYAEMAKASARGASIASMGKADVDMVLGRYAEARAELQSGAAADEAANLRLPQALKLVALAEIASVTSAAEAAALAAQALTLAATEAVAVPAARFLIAGGRGEAAAKLAAGLEARIQKRSRAMAAVIRAEAALAAKKPIEAIDQLIAARSLADLWLVHYMLGRAYVEHGRFAEAIAELEACEQRIGEASDVFLDDWPTFRYTVPVKYWLARAQDGLGQRDSAVRNYQAYLDRRASVAGDPLATDARKRMSR